MDSLTNTSMSVTKIENIIHSVLQQEFDCLEHVITLLYTENSAIMKRDVVSMGHLLDKKLPLLSRLEQLDQQRQDLFSQVISQISILDDTKTDNTRKYTQAEFDQYLEQDSTQENQQLWQKIKDQLPECKKQNEINGRMIAIKKDNTEQLLQILLGQPSQASAATYSQLGQTKLQKRSALYNTSV